VRVLPTSRICFLIIFLSVCISATAQSTGNIVRGKFGGLIFGFDIDPNGTEGLLTEAVLNSDGTVHAAVETFDQQSGKILKVVIQSSTKDDFVTLGVVGNSVGLVEREHPVTLLDVKRTFFIINPLNSNQLTKPWTPPIGTNHIVTQVRRDSGSSETVVLARDLSTASVPFLFSSDVAANTFGPVIQIVDKDFNFEEDPVVAFDSKTNQAILGHHTLSQFIVPPKIRMVDLTTSVGHEFIGKGLGLINGIAVDSADGVLCTTTSFVPEVQFYNLSTETGSSQSLPGATDSLARGQAVEYDSVNKLFLVAQPFTSTGTTGSSIQVYDTKGNFVESINGLSFNGTGNVFPVHMALNPSLRMGYVDGPNTNGTEIQSFTY
jgi:hypothetical protein